MARFAAQLGNAGRLPLEDLGKILLKAKYALEQNLDGRYAIEIADGPSNSNVQRLAGKKLDEPGDPYWDHLNTVKHNRQMRVDSLNSPDANNIAYRPRETWEDRDILAAAELGLIEPTFLNQLGGMGYRGKFSSQDVLSDAQAAAKFKQNAIDIGSGRDVLFGGPIVDLPLDGGHISPAEHHPELATLPSNIRPEYANDNRALQDKEGDALKEYAQFLLDKVKRDIANQA